jgi:hypothetical protein
MSFGKPRYFVQNSERNRAMHFSKKVIIFCRAVIGNLLEAQEQRNIDFNKSTG